MNEYSQMNPLDFGPGAILYQSRYRPWTPARGIMSLWLALKEAEMAR